MERHIVIVGNPLLGFEFYGPFYERDEAFRFTPEARRRSHNAALLAEDDFWIASLSDPDDDEDEKVEGHEGDDEEDEEGGEQNFA